MRNLEREISKLARKAVKQILTGKTKTVAITADNMSGFSRRAAIPLRRGGAEDQVGVVTGLAWTEVGGELLTIEGVMMPGKGPHDRHRQSARRHEGVDLGGGVLCPLARGRFRHRAAAVRPARHPRARAGRRDAQGWSVGRRCHGDGDRLDR